MLRLNVLCGLVLTGLCLSSAFAEEDHIKLVGTTPGYVHYEKPAFQGGNEKSQLVTGQPIQYLRYHLSQNARKWLAKHIDDPFNDALFHSSIPASQVSLGMNNVPVLNQGVHGTCVTFALSAAVDAIVSHTNYISELCNLSLGNYLSNQNTGYPSGWDGSTASHVLNQMKIYGINSSDTQKKYGCAGKHKYPVKHIGDKGNAMSIDAFSAHSELIMKKMTWKPIRMLEASLSDNLPAPALINNVKTGLDNGHRVAIAFILNEDGNNGAQGTYHVKNDSWIVTDETISQAKHSLLRAGHEVIITGYDDNAVINGPDGSLHHGVFTLRNSWGKRAGDKGDYYMSYDYLSKLSLELYELIPTT